MATPGGRIGGKIFFHINGTRQLAKGNFTYNLGTDLREPVVGSDEVHGYTEKPQAPYIEGEITDRGDLDVKAMLGVTAATITLELTNGKTVLLRDGWHGGEGNVQTDEGNIAVKFYGRSAEEVTT